MDLWTESLFLKLTFCKRLMTHEDIIFDPIHGDVFPGPAPNCEQTKHNMKKLSVFCIN